MTPEQQLHAKTLTQRPAPETILGVHGLLAGSSYLGPFAALVDGRYEVVAPELLGFGDSPRRPDSAYTPEEHAAVLGLFIDSSELADSRFTLVGHSLGGVVCAAYAAENPERVKHLVIAGAPVHSSIEEGHALAHDAAKVLHLMATKPGGQLLHGVLFGSRLAKLYAGVRFDWDVAEDADKHTYESFSRSLLGVIHRPGGVIRNLREARDAGVPTTFILGRDDKWVGIEGRNQLRQLRDLGLQFVEVPGGHDLLYTNPQVIVDRLAV
jgi:pimeloyl-ACP methyl ester carboxylesterase